MARSEADWRRAAVGCDPVPIADSVALSLACVAPGSGPGLRHHRKDIQ